MNPIIEAVEGGHVTASREVFGTPPEYTGAATCQFDGEPMPCTFLRAARTVNAQAARQS